MWQLIKQPWPWYVSGPLIGLVVPALLILGNKTFGISSSLRHICSACIPAGIPFFTYNWRKEAWNLFFVTGIVGGGFLAANFLQTDTFSRINPKLVQELGQYGIHDLRAIVPHEIFSWEKLLSVKGLVMMLGGGFLVGFGTRYAGGCTSGHSIMGLANLQWPSLVATVCFMAGGILMANLILPLLLKL